jgi:AcrR family transcriptional regulator
MMAQDDPSSFRPPRQARSRATLDRLLEATEGLLAEIPFEEATVSEIARRSNSSVGAFYNRFSDKDALLDCLDDRFFRRARQHWEAFFGSAQWRRGRLERRILRLVTLLVRTNREHRPVLRSLALYLYTRPDPRYVARRAQLEDYVVGEIRKQVFARPGGIAHPNPPLAVDLGLRMILSTVQDLILFDDRSGETPPSDEDLATELTRAYLSYLGIYGSSQGEGR